MFCGSPTLVYTGNYHPGWSSYFVSNNRALYFEKYVFQEFITNLQCLDKKQLGSFKKHTSNFCEFLFLQEA